MARSGGLEAGSSVVDNTELKERESRDVTSLSNICLCFSSCCHKASVACSSADRNLRLQVERCILKYLTAGYMELGMRYHGSGCEVYNCLESL